METKVKPYKRRLRNFLIYPSFQLGLLAVQTLIIVLIFAVVEFENSAAFARMTKMGTDLGLPAENAYFDFVADQAHGFLTHTAVAFVVALVISSAVTLYLSFRLAGPIYRLRKHMRQIAEQGTDDLEPLRFRNGDFYSDLPATVNQAVDRLKNGPRGNA